MSAVYNTFAVATSFTVDNEDLTVFEVFLITEALHFTLSRCRCLEAKKMLHARLCLKGKEECPYRHNKHNKNCR